MREEELSLEKAVICHETTFVIRQGCDLKEDLRKDLRENLRENLREDLS